MENKPKFTKLRLVSDGTRVGTFLKDENDNVIDNVTEIKWEACADGGFVNTSIKLINTPAEIANISVESHSLQSQIPRPRKDYWTEEGADDDKNISFIVTKAKHSDYLNIKIVGSDNLTISIDDLRRIISSNEHTYAETKYEQT
jgi:hypothetical protein